MQLISLLLAAGATFFALVTHITIGTAQNASPILDNSTLPESPRNTLIFSWRANSVLMLFMTIAFVYGFFWDMPELVIYNALLAGALGLLAIIVALKAGINPIKFPPMPLFLCIASFGFCSVIL